MKKFGKNNLYFGVQVKKTQSKSASIPHHSTVLKIMPVYTVVGVLVRR